MSEEPEVFYFDPTPAETSLPPAGATRMWMVLGEPNVGAKVKVCEMVTIADDEGQGFAVPTGEWIESTVIEG